MDTKDKLHKAREAALLAAAKVTELETRLAYEESFEQDGRAWLVLRRCIDTGRMSGMEGIFLTESEAYRFAEGLAGYGVGKDIFVESLPLYR